MQSNEEIVKQVLASEAFEAGVSKLVHTEFEAVFQMVSTPFLVVTVPLAMGLCWMVIDKFKDQSTATDHLAAEIGKLAMAVAHIEGVNSERA